jgi:hypothetical protein
LLDQHAAHFGHFAQGAKQAAIRARRERDGAETGAHRREICDSEKRDIIAVKTNAIAWLKIAGLQDAGQRLDLGAQIAVCQRLVAKEQRRPGIGTGFEQPFREIGQSFMPFLARTSRTFCTEAISMISSISNPKPNSFSSAETMFMWPKESHLGTSSGTV